MADIVMRKLSHAVDLGLLRVGHVVGDRSYVVDSGVVKRRRVGAKGLILGYTGCWRWLVRVKGARRRSPRFVWRFELFG